MSPCVTLVPAPKLPTAWAVAASAPAPVARWPEGRRRREGGDGTAKVAGGGSAGGGGGKRVGDSDPMLTLESEVPLSGAKGST